MGGEVVLPRVREQGRRAALVKPVNLALSQEEDAAEDELRHGRRVPLRIGESEGRAPRPPEDLPALDAQVLAVMASSMSSTRCHVVLSTRLAWGVLFPQPRWSKRMMRYAAGSKKRRCLLRRCRRQDHRARTPPACRAGFPTARSGARGWARRAAFPDRTAQSRGRGRAVPCTMVITPVGAREGLARPPPPAWLRSGLRATWPRAASRRTTARARGRASSPDSRGFLVVDLEHDVIRASLCERGEQLVGLRGGHGEHRSDLGRGHLAAVVVRE